MSDKFNKLEQNAISYGTSRRSLEISEYCVKCLQETDITHLNIANGVCLSCKPNTIKLTKEQIEKLVDLYD
jgi:hypothetical protein